MRVENPKYVVFDGMDGCGKGTQIELLKKRLPDSVTFTREPGGSGYAEDVRKLLLENPLAGSSTPLAHFLLFWAAREDTLQNLVVPALQLGQRVFSDRGDSSTFAFQICGEQREEFSGLFGRLRNDFVFSAARGRRKPDLYIVLDLPAEQSRERALRDAARVQTHFDVRDVDYYQRVRDGFHRFHSEYGPVRFVDATQSPERLHRDICMVLAGEMIIPELALFV